MLSRIWFLATVPRSLPGSGASADSRYCFGVTCDHESYSCELFQIACKPLVEVLGGIRLSRPSCVCKTQVVAGMPAKLHLMAVFLQGQVEVAKQPQEGGRECSQLRAARLPRSAARPHADVLCDLRRIRMAAGSFVTMGRKTPAQG